ncbi:cytochrome P450 [Peniophora sp. CONT]|nr:cytochrome P450 [Peniophora sp. CONT]
MLFIIAGLTACLAIHRHPIQGDTALLLILIQGILAFVYNYVHEQRFVESACGALLGTAQLLLTLVASTVAYRLSPYHPLARFPGPVINKATSLRIMYVVATGRRHLYIEDLHRKYGKFVRTGPNTLSINSHAAVGPIYANANAFDRSDAYIVPGSTEKGIFFMTSRAIHATRRRLWAGAFTSQSVANYTPKLIKRTDQLVGCVAKRSDKQGVVDIGECIQHWSYDVMGDLTFGGSNRLELMDEGDPQDLVRSGQLATCVFEILGEVPSLFQIVWYLPATAIVRRLEDLAYDMMVVRRAAGDSDKDLASHVLKGIDDDDPFKDEVLRMDAIFAIQAGSDTTTGVVTLTIYLLLSHPDVAERLLRELDDAFASRDDISMKDLEALPYLDAVITESCRLGSPFPGLPRVVPEQGAMLDGVYVPGGTTVGVPAHAQEVSEENFWPEPKSYRPERWLDGGLGPGSRAVKAAIMTFSYGPFGCLGKALAIQELKLIVAHLFLAYDIKFAPGFDPHAFEAGVRNLRTTIFDHPLIVTATSRT